MKQDTDQSQVNLRQTRCENRKEVKVAHYPVPGFGITCVTPLIYAVRIL
jgi:hypothetical protein